MDDVYNDTELLELCAAARDGELTPERFNRLHTMLAASPARRRFYLRFMNMHAMLERYQSAPDQSAVPVTPIPFPPAIPRSRRAWVLASGLVAACVVLTLLAVRLISPKVDQVEVANTNQSTPQKKETFSSGAYIGEASRGALLLRNNTGKKIAARMKLEAGDILITPGNSSVVIRYGGEETIVGIFSGSRVVFDRIESAKHIRLVHGELVCDVAKQEPDKPLTLNTPHAQAVVLGTQFVLSADDKKSHLRVNEGMVRFTDLASRETVEAVAGYESEAGAGIKLGLLQRAGVEPPRVTGFTLVNADDGLAIPGFDPIQDGAIIRLGDLPSPRLSIRANTAPFSVGTVKFSIAGTGTDGGDLEFFNHAGHNFANHAEIWWPYHITGDDDSFSSPRPRIWVAQPGQYTLSAVAFLPAISQGLKSERNKIKFKIER